MPRKTSATRLPKKASALNTTFKTPTVGDLLDELARIARDPEVSGVLDAAIESRTGDTFTSFRIVTRTLSDGSQVLDFEFMEER